MRRQGLVCLLRTQPDFEVIGEFSEGYQLLELPGTLIPDIVLTDLDLPTINHIEPSELIHQWNPNQRILILADKPSPLQAVRALRNGSLGYVVRLGDFEQLAQAIRTVASDHRYVSPMVLDEILDAVIAGKTFETEVDERISSREREILLLIAEGRTNQEIGKQLEISIRTVETHRTNIMRKLSLSSQIDIVRYAYNHGLLSVE
jgi:two-component system response regulator NreC